MVSLAAPAILIKYQQRTCDEVIGISKASNDQIKQTTITAKIKVVLSGTQTLLDIFPSCMSPMLILTSKMKVSSCITPVARRILDMRCPIYQGGR